MSTITSLTSNETGANSLTDINNNFSNLNTDKVEGQASSVDSEIALFSGTGGKTIKRHSGSGFVKSTSGVISNVSNIVESDLSFSDNTTGNASTTAHGFLKKLSNSATDFLDGTGAFDTVKDSDLSTSDITTNDVSTSKHGFVPKAPNDSSKFLRGDGTWATTGAASGIGWTLKSHSTASAASSITVSSLDLGTDLAYKVFVRASNGNAGHLRVTFNTDTSTTNFFVRYGWATTGGTVGTSGNGTAPHQISHATADSHYGEFTIFKASPGAVRTFLQGIATGSDTGTLTYGINYHINWNTTSNLTSIKFDSSVNHDWEVTILKVATA